MLEFKDNGRFVLNGKDEFNMQRINRAGRDREHFLSSTR